MSRTWRMKTRKELRAAGWETNPSGGMYKGGRSVDPDMLQNPPTAKQILYLQTFKDHSDERRTPHGKDVWHWYRELFTQELAPWRMKTEEELIAGGRWRDGDFLSGGDMSVHRSMLDHPLAAVQIETLFDGSCEMVSGMLSPETKSPHTWCWTPDMFTAVEAPWRVKTREELLREGWEQNPSFPDMPFALIKDGHRANLKIRQRDLDKGYDYYRECYRGNGIEKSLELITQNPLPSEGKPATTGLTPQETPGDCPCKAKKFGFIGHEPWCSEFQTRDQMFMKETVEAPISQEDFMTASDHDPHH